MMLSQPNRRTTGNISLLYNTLMLSAVHGTTGAFIASLCPGQPWLYLPSAVALHYLEDAIPHWDLGTGMRRASRHRVLITAGLEVFDLLAMFLIIFFLFQKSWPTTWAEINWPVWIGALGGILPDLLESPSSFFHVKLKPLAPFMKLHAKAHSSLALPLYGLLPQLLILISIAYLALTYPTFPL